jgi:P63C domain
MVEFGSSEAGKKGGDARAEKLSKGERSLIAREAAVARWEKEGKLKTGLRATHMGEISIGDIVLPCAVLSDGTRVISQRGMSKGLGRVTTGSGTHYSKAKNGVARLPTFLSGKNIKSLVEPELEASLLKPIEYFPTHGGRTAHGFRADLVPQICDVWLTAREQGKLQTSQEHIADRAYILMKGLAKVGIIALVDEATGYQEVRDRFALQQILDKYLRKEFAAWAKRFPDEFYQEIFRLRKWVWKGMRINRPQCVAAYTKNLVYARLAPGILDDLEHKNPINDRGHRLAMHHQWLTEDIGHPALAQHLHAVLGLMRASDNWQQMMRLVNRAFPKRGNRVQIELFNKDEIDEE